MKYEDIPNELLIKFIPEECYCKKLLNDGEMLFKFIKAFIDDENIGRGDPNEFTALKEGFRLKVFNNKIQDYEPLLNFDQIIGDMKSNLDCLIYSMYYTTKDKLLKIPLKIIDDFGGNECECIYGVVFDFHKFNNVVSEYLNLNNYKWESNFVEYHDISDSNCFDYFFNGRAKFRKDAKFNYQNEYRFVIQNDLSLESKINVDLNGILFKIGSLSEYGFLIRIDRK